jgi:DNA-binding GntR family transcriptional regulator
VRRRAVLNERQLATWQLLTEDGDRLSLREIQERVGTSSISVVRWDLEQLRALGIVECPPRQARSIRLLKPYEGRR